MAEALAKLHAVSPDAVGLGDYGRPGNYFERQIARWTRQLRESQGERIAELETVADVAADNCTPMTARSPSPMAITGSAICCSTRRGPR